MLPKMLIQRWCLPLGCSLCILSFCHCTSAVSSNSSLLLVHNYSTNCVPPSHIFKLLLCSINFSLPLNLKLILSLQYPAVSGPSQAFTTLEFRLAGQDLVIWRLIFSQRFQHSDSSSTLEEGMEELSQFRPSACFQCLTGCGSVEEQRLPGTATLKLPVHISTDTEIAAKVPGSIWAPLISDNNVNSSFQINSPGCKSSWTYYEKPNYKYQDTRGALDESIITIFLKM